MQFSENCFKNSIRKLCSFKTNHKQFVSSGVTVDLLIGTDFADAFNDMHVISRKSGEPIARRNCFGWYVIGTFSGQVNQSRQELVQWMLEQSASRGHEETSHTRFDGS